MEKAFSSVSTAFSGGDETPITRNRINKIPYATMSAKVGDGPRALIVLGRADGFNLHWFAADRTVMVTRHGRLVRTAGLPFNLKGTRLLGDEPLTTMGRRREGVPPYKREIDLAPPNRYGVIIDATVEELGPETIEISELSFETVAYRESCRARDMDWKFTNFYWVSPSNGLLWKSLQHAHPEIPAIELQLLKPAIL